MPDPRLDRMLLSLEGLSIGDAFGEQFFHVPESWAAERRTTKGEWPWTDDTAMALSVAEVLALRGEIDQDELARRFGERYLDDARRGYGANMHRVLLGIAGGGRWRALAEKSFGNEGSMGNGGAMRAAPLGAYFAGDEPSRIVEQARLSASVTHSHPEGEAGAIVVALATAWTAQHANCHYWDFVLENTPAGTTRRGVEIAAKLDTKIDRLAAAALLGCGRKLTAPDTVPICLWMAAKHLPDFGAAMWALVDIGGDVDTTCAIAGGIMAPACGLDAIPAEWRQRREPWRLRV